ncbi:unnamed protein product [Umbelopsis vinacea]
MLVTGTARNQAKAKKIQKAFGKYGNNRLDITITGDLEGGGAFDDAVKVTFTPTDPFKDVINPAINGTRSLLKSAIKYGKNVKHVVFTSSIIACIKATAEKTPYIFTEKEWNDQTIEDNSSLEAGRYSECLCDLRNKQMKPSALCGGFKRRRH